MSDTYSSLLFHCVWSTKNRWPILIPPFDHKAYDFIGGIVTHNGGKIFAIGGMPDHVHILFSMKPANSVANMMRQIKSGSSKMLCDFHIDMLQFSWQNGYGAFSVSKLNVDSVIKYIKNQAIHHKEQSFESEFNLLLERHGVLTLKSDF